MPVRPSTRHPLVRARASFLRVTTASSSKMPSLGAPAIAMLVLYFLRLVIRFGPCALVPAWQPKHSGTQFGGSDAHGFIQAMAEWWMMTQSDILVHTGAVQNRI
jgi:hypothetical protein